MNAPRTKNSEETRNRLLDAGEEVMLAKGYVAATVDGICEAAGVTKGSFFHHFRNKEEIGKALVTRFAGRQGERFTAACGEIADPLDRIYCIVDCVIEASRSPEMKGCLVGTLAQEISKTHPELGQLCQASFDAFSGQLAKTLEEAKALHCPDAEFDAASLGHYFVSLGQGSMLLGKNDGDWARMEGNMKHFRDYLRNLFGR